MDLLGGYDANSDNEKDESTAAAASSATTTTTMSTSMEYRKPERADGHELIVRKDPNNYSLEITEPAQVPQVDDPSAQRNQLTRFNLEKNIPIDPASFAKQRKQFQRTGQALGPDDKTTVVRTTLGYNSNRLRQFELEEKEREKRHRELYGSDDDADGSNNDKEKGKLMKKKRVKRYKPMEVQAELGKIKDDVKRMLEDYIMKEIFPVLKFAEREILGNILLSAEKREGTTMNRRRDIPDDDYIRAFSGKVSTVFSNLRHNTQINSRTTFLKDSKDLVNKIPDNFPDGVLIEKDNCDLAVNEAKYTIDPEYRTKSSAGFLYFATKVLPCVNAQRTNFRVKCRTEVLSKIFTESDEAYALALLINEYDSYQFKLQNENEGGVRPMKPFTSSASGSKLGWNPMGMETYVNLYVKVKTLRSQQVSKELENTMLEGYQDQESRKKKQKKRDLQSTMDQDSEVFKMLYPPV